ncbi:MAG: TIGR02186 family protein [Alphaproteobacteria bacterium]
MRRIFALVAIAAGLAPGLARAQPLVADLSDHLVAITTGFTGSDVLLFGAIEGEGEVVVVVHGPLETAVVRRKEQIAGVWLNVEEAAFPNIPVFYSVMATEPIEDWLSQTLRERHQIGVESLKLPVMNSTPGGVEPPGTDAFRAALLRNKQRLGHYSETVGKISMLSARLFRTDLHFPTNVPTGIYTVEVFLIRDNAVISAETTPLYVTKTGVSAEIFLFAQRHGLLYGFGAVLFAVLAGLGANAVFRRF